MSNYPDVIYLMEGDDGVVWCDDPDPSSCGETDSVEYIRTDKAKPQVVTVRPTGPRPDITEQNNTLHEAADALNGYAAELWLSHTLQGGLWPESDEATRRHHDRLRDIANRLLLLTEAVGDQ